MGRLFLFERTYYLGNSQRRSKKCKNYKAKGSTISPSPVPTVNQPLIFGKAYWACHLCLNSPILMNRASGIFTLIPVDGRLITVFTSEDRTPKRQIVDQGQGYLHHLAFNVSKVSYDQAVERLKERGIPNSGPVDRGFMDSLYFRDPCGMLIELASYRFEPPHGYTHSDVLHRAHLIRVAAGDDSIDKVHLADAIEALVAQRGPSLSS